jgi:alanine-alpha-ketoisovalerate/valine-pyruvate aminotransferase
LINNKKRERKLKILNTKNAYFCLDCESIQCDNKHCRVCSSRALYPLGKWLTNDNIKLPDEYYPEEKNERKTNS